MMLTFSKIVYSVFVNCYHFFIGLASFFNEKAYRFTTGRINQIVQENKEKTIWFHCASLGEFEQAKPLINYCYNHLRYEIILSFFSPSGYTYKVNFPLAKAVYYLPKDGPSQAKKWIKNINPAMAFFIKYEFWYYHLAELKNQNIPHYLVAGIFRKDQIFFKSYGVLHQKMLASFTHIFVQDQASSDLLKSEGISKHSIAFDTRFDAVKSISELNFSNEFIEEFIGNKQCLVVGSSWLKDEELIASCLDSLNDFKIIIAPHEVNPKRIEQIQALFPSSSLLSEPIHLAESKILIVDSIGKLSLIYRYAHLCYIGGGFGVSVHNILEAAVYGKLCFFGPKHQKSKEALELLALNAAFTFANKTEFLFNLSALSNQDYYLKASLAAKDYVSERLGGTQKIIMQLKSDKVI